MSTKMTVFGLNPDWMDVLNDEFAKFSFKNLISFLNEQRAHKTIFPNERDVFNTYNLTPFKNVKVVILGQDPYHGFGQAHGLSFSVLKGIRQPPSLRNIFKELESDIGIKAPDKFMGELTSWANQGVFLLNAVLTVEQGQPNSHKGKGWEQFTDATIKAISDKKENVVFILWGYYAKQKAELIDSDKHLVLSSPHPSPFAARHGFFGSQPFSKTNTYLQETKQTPVDWRIE